jgi:hypothetical protein
MRVQFPEGDGPLDPEWFRPLFDLFPTIPAEGSLKYFDPDDFMVMGRIVRPPRPSITLYKHRYTRRYLNLDASGQAYRYFAPPLGSGRSGQYRQHKELRSALSGLGLWELPQLKPMLARVLAEDPPWDDDLLDGDESCAEAEQAEQVEKGERGHGHLRLV